MKPITSVGVREAARKLGCTTKYIYDLLYGGQLPGQKVGKIWTIPVESIAMRLKQKREPR
jgi:excisionase family DNA binding protein